MSRNTEVSFWYSWYFIIAMLFIFWPAGVILMVKRLSMDRKAAMRRGKTIGAVGIASYCLAAIGILACMSEGAVTADDVTFILMFAAIGVVFRYISKRTAREAANVRRYLAIIVNQNVRSIDSIASFIGNSYDDVKAELQKMIDKGYLRDAYINEAAREIVLPDDAPAQPEAPNSTEAAPAKRVVACKCCGAKNVVEGPVGYCQYCGSPIKE